MPRRLEQVREATPRSHYSIRTEDADVLRMMRSILFHRERHPLEMGQSEVVACLSHLAVHRHVAASTQNQDPSALLSLDKVVLDRPLAWLDDRVVRAKTSQRSPTIFSRDEARAVPAQLDGTARLAAGILDGSGLRLMECLRLRVKDADFDRSHIIVRDGKGRKDRATVLPHSLIEPLRRQVDTS